MCEHHLKRTSIFDVISENLVFSFKIPGPARVLLPILPSLLHGSPLDIWIEAILLHCVSPNMAIRNSTEIIILQNNTVYHWLR